MSEVTRTAGAPTVVLVHGAFADASSWNGVIERLQAKGVQVTAVANPLRGVSIDAAYLAGVVNQIDGPVLLVGHLRPRPGRTPGRRRSGLQGQRPEQRAGPAPLPGS
jgi:intracellular sulfur oxidation DsrE/DsrF family protein